jgi:pimeloyl-ACP methyl ester carboxylesterase
LNPYDAPLPAPLASRVVDGVRGMHVHVLEAGMHAAGKPCVLLLHGFPELAWSWREVMPRLAATCRVIAPDLRGYGGTTGWRGGFADPVSPFGMLELVQDVLALLDRLDVGSVDCVAGHDFGSPLAAWCALLHPGRFRRVVMMSAPFGGPPATGDPAAPGSLLIGAPIHAALAALAPPKKHYQAYFAGADAAADMRDPPRGLHAFLRDYMHAKSGDWPGNRPVPLAGWRADELARMPGYYVMDLAATMPAAVAPMGPGPRQGTPGTWLPDDALGVYARAFATTGFQGALQWYRAALDAGEAAKLAVHAGRRVEVPSRFVAGAQDWGIHQRPGDLQRMASRACADFCGTQLVTGAGHWVPQEAPDAVARTILEALADVPRVR